MRSRRYCSLHAFRSPDEPARLWRKEIDFDFGINLRVHGFAAIRATGSTSHAGFALFRRSRLIQGMRRPQGYRPDTVFGNSNSYRYQRLFGELHLEGSEGLPYRATASAGMTTSSLSSIC